MSTSPTSYSPPSHSGRTTSLDAPLATTTGPVENSRMQEALLLLSAATDFGDQGRSLAQRASWPAESSAAVAATDRVAQAGLDLTVRRSGRSRPHKSTPLPHSSQSNNLIGLRFMLQAALCVRILDEIFPPTDIEVGWCTGEIYRLLYPQEPFDKPNKRLLEALRSTLTSLSREGCPLRRYKYAGSWCYARRTMMPTPAIGSNLRCQPPSQPTSSSMQQLTASLAERKTHPSSPTNMMGEPELIEVTEPPYKRRRVEEKTLAEPSQMATEKQE